MKKFIFLFLLGISAMSFSAQAYGQKVVTAAQVNGTWREVSSKPAGVTTEFWIWATGNGQMKVEFFANNAVKKFSNTAIDMAAIDGITAVFKPADAQSDENSPCVMTLKFSADKLIVTEKGECGWGAGVSAAGTYKKVSPKKPKFDEQ